MKNTLKIFMALIMITGLWSCENEENFKILEPQAAAFAIITPNTNVSTILNKATPNNNALTLTWESVSYGTPTDVTYTVQFAKFGTEFAAPIDISASNATNFSMTVSELNSRALELELIPETEGPIEVRIKTSIGALGVDEKFSNSIILLVTPYSTQLPKIYLIGNFLEGGSYGNNWSPANTLPALASSAFGQTDFEGYVYFANGDANYKFLPKNSTFDGDYGDAGPSDGSYTGIIEQTDEVNAGLPNAEAGYYLVKVNTGDLTYSLTRQDWRIIGAATPNGWGNDTNLTYDPISKTFSGIMNLVPEQFKFRANADWSNPINNFGKDGEGNFKNGGDNFVFDGPAGSYKVTLDLSNPRAYSYTITAN